MEAISLNNQGKAVALIKPSGAPSRYILAWYLSADIGTSTFPFHYTVAEPLGNQHGFIYFVSHGNAAQASRRCVWCRRQVFIYPFRVTLETHGIRFKIGS